MWVGPARGTAHTGEYPMVSWLLPCTRWSLVETTSFLFLLSSAPHCTREAGLLSPVYPPPSTPWFPERADQWEGRARSEGPRRGGALCFGGCSSQAWEIHSSLPEGSWEPPLSCHHLRTRVGASQTFLHRGVHENPFGCFRLRLAMMMSPDVLSPSYSNNPICPLMPFGGKLSLKATELASYQPDPHFYTSIYLLSLGKKKTKNLYFLANQQDFTSFRAGRISWLFRHPTYMCSSPRMDFFRRTQYVHCHKTFVLLASVWYLKITA